MPTYSHADFARDVLIEFPELRGDVDDYDGLLTLELGAFAQFTQRAKGRGDWDTYKRCIAFIDRLLAGADSELDNAIHVAYLEHLDFNGPRGPTAWGILSPTLQAAWKRITIDNERLRSRPVKRKRR